MSSVNAGIGWTEISAVCTHGIQERDGTPFLHVLASSTNAVRIYEHLGFRLRPRTEMVIAGSVSSCHRSPSSTPPN